MNSVHFLTSQSKRNTVDFFSLENQTDGATRNESSFIQLTGTAQGER